MTDDRSGGLLNLSAEQIEKKLDRLAQKLRALAGGVTIGLKLDSARAEAGLAALNSANQATASAIAKVYKNYQDAIGRLKSLKSLSRLTYEQELEYLTAIRENMDAYNLSTKEALDLQQRLLTVQEEIARRDAQSLDTLLSGVMDALAARYETMRDAELTMLSQSREAWQAWQESSSDAIRAQIDALDELAEAEDREKEENGHLRRIEKLSQALQYEQDGFNRGQLAAQLEDAQAAYEDWLSGVAREDERAALRTQLEAVNARAEAELDAISAQANAVNEAYAAQLETASLMAEAQQQLMAGTQEELLKLITAYAPDYNAAGQTLGEQMLAGFAEKTGGIASWMESLNAMIQSVQETLNASLQSAADSFYLEHAAAAATGVTITQQNTFNTPVESPSETAWRIKAANEALAAELLEA